MCRELGFLNGTATHSHYWYYIVPMWLRHVMCLGNETSLLQCSHDGFGNIGNCTNRETAGVKCTGVKGTDYKQLSL